MLALGMPHQPLSPILCARLLRKVDEPLVDLLHSLTPSEWDLSTIAPLWKVRDVAAHLLDTGLRKLSMVRDCWHVDTVKVQSPLDVLALVNRLNQEGVAVFRRLSPRVLIELMQNTCRESANFHESLDPFAVAAFNVSWAGEEVSLNWFDAARELTERWHHQQQIRIATNRPGLMVRELYHPVLDCFVRGLPHLYRDVDAPPDALVLIEVSGDCGGRWYLCKEPSGWRLVEPCEARPVSLVIIPQEIAWRVFTKGIDFDSARTATRIEGDVELGERVLRLKAIVG
jgi:uncharacterized protein (TIGR03083 family)